ncbi:MAG TPA: DUF1573 domain-containing protein [Candidatus Eisenbacteria bacterium]|nr:DUF1573 domain-containing protein [Candidatus Eisenbacteria bacterium]
MNRTSTTILSLLAFIAIFAGINATSGETLAAKSTASPNTGTPRIQFETNFYDLGKMTSVENITGAFKFKNVGDGTLKIDPPQASCDCTEPFVKPDTVAPGESGEILYVIKLDRPLKGQRIIHVHSNDPNTPVMQLKLELDATPLYELSTKTLWVMLPAGHDQVQSHLTLTRTDGKPLGIERFTASEKWVTAAFDPSFKPEDNSGQINITVRRPPGPPSMINATVQMWTSNQTTRPVQTLTLTGEVQGEVAAVPPRLYWVIPDFGKNKSDYPAEALTRKIELLSLLGHDVEIKNATSGVQGLNVQVLPKEPKKSFDLVLRFDSLPKAFTNSKITVETSLASLPKLEVPVTISVPGPE